MQVEVEYPVVVHGRPKRAATEKLILARDTVVVEIPEYSSQDILRAVDLHADFGDGMIGISYDTFEGGLYTAVPGEAPAAGLHRYAFGSEATHYPPFLSNYHDEAVEILGLSNRWHHTRLFPPEVERAVRFPDKKTTVVPPLLDEVRGSVEEATVERSRSRFLAHMEKFILVDGRLMTHVVEPALVVSVDKYASNVVTVQALKQDAVDPFLGVKTGVCIPTCVFRLDQADEALRYAEDLIEASTDNLSTPRLRDFVKSSTVHDSGLLRLDERVATLECISNWVLEKASIEAGRFYPDEIDALRQARRRLSDDGGDALEEAIRSFRALPEDAVGNPFSGYGAELLPVLWARMDEPDIVLHL